MFKETSVIRRKRRFTTMVKNPLANKLKEKQAETLRKLRSNSSSLKRMESSKTWTEESIDGLMHA